MSLSGPLSSGLSGALSRGAVSSEVVPDVIGGVAVGQAGAAGTIYEAYVLRDGDDFDRTTTADFLTPTNNSGAYMTTRHYGIQSSAPKYLRGASSLGGYEADPWHTGYKDANRGVVPASYADTIVYGGSTLKLKSRRATSAEKLLMGDLAGKNNISSMVHMGRRNMMRAPCIMEMRLRYPYALASWDQWHPTFWVLQSQPGNGFDGLELDCEGFTPALQFNRNTWNNGVGSFGPTLGTTSAVSKTVYRDYSFEIVQVGGVWKVRLFENGVLVAEGSPDYGGNVFDPSRPFHLMVTNHILQSGLTQSVFDNAGDAGAEMECDWWRAWSPATGIYRKPKVAAAQYLADFNSNFSFALPEASIVWGAGASGDVVEMIPNEDNSPAQPWVRGLLPPSVTRTGDTLSGKIADQPGRLILARSFTPNSGDGCMPQPVTICIGPRVVPAAIDYFVGQSFVFDAYAAVDCGDLHWGKTVSVTGLPAWANYNNSTGLITGTPTDTGTTNITISGTNAVGQSVSRVVALQKSTAFAYQSWSGPLWIDASDTSTITESSGAVSAVGNKRSGVTNLTKGGAAVALVANAQNGRSVLRFARDTANPARLFGATGNSALDTMCQGNDKPYTVISVYKPTDGNTGYIWAWSDTVDSTNSQQIALIRRTATASSVRRQLVEATNNDVAFGSGQASGAWRIVAVVHTGTAVTVYDNSLTPIIDGAAQDVASFNSELTFRIGASESLGSTDPTLAQVACAMDLGEMVVVNAVKSAADVQQAITDLASKWAITLT